MRRAPIFKPAAEFGRAYRGLFFIAEHYVSSGRGRIVAIGGYR